MRINQLRHYDIFLESDEELVYEQRKGYPPVMIQQIKIWPTKTGALMIRFDGYFYDPFDVTVTEAEGEIAVDPKRKDFAVECDIAALKLPPEDPVMQFLGKLNVMRQDEMSMDQFMKEESPVG